MNLSLPLNCFVWALVGCFGLGCLSAFAGPRAYRTLRTNVALGLAFLGSLVAVGGAIWFWAHPLTVGVELFSVQPFLPGLPQIAPEFFVDRLAALFLLLTGLFSAGVALYSLAWLQRVEERHRIAGAYNLFVLSTLLTIMANNIYFLLCFLEATTLTFAYLALYRHNKDIGEHPDQDPTERSKLAFKVYLIFSHVGGIFLVTALLGLAVFAHSFDFDVFRSSRFTLPTGTASVLFILALIGLGIKVGMFPFHVWVPTVHPYSPTTTHAFSLGVAIKIGIYLMVRVFFQFLHPIEWWWGWAVLLLAGLTALVGVFYALVGRDLKTALASHSVENIGIILAGVGLALIYATGSFAGQVAIHSLAGLALIASLYHTLNHATFKGLLYLATGAIENRTGVVDLDQLGGLMRYYPWTSTAFLVGATAIAGFPPLNGFISEWLTLQSLFAGIGLFATSQRLPLLIGLIAALLLLGGAFGLTALAFVKIAGEALLGAPRRPELMARAERDDVPWVMRSVILILAAFCLALGLFPTVVIRELGLLTSDLGLPADLGAAGWLAVGLQAPLAPGAGAPDHYTATLSVPLLLLLTAIIVLPAIRVALWRRRSRYTFGPVWTCGVPFVSEAMQFTGSAIASLIWQPLERTARPEQERQAPTESGEYLPSKQYLSETRYVPEFFLRGYNRALAWSLTFSERVGQRFQNGDVRRYLLYIFGTFILVLSVAALIVLLNRGL